MSSIPSLRSTRPNGMPSLLSKVLALSFMPIQALAKRRGGGVSPGGGGGRGSIIISDADGDAVYSNFPTGAFIGGVFGAVAGMLLIAMGFYWCQTRRTRAKDDLHVDDDANKDVLPMYQPSPAYPILGTREPDSTTVANTPYPDISASTMPLPNYDAPTSTPSAASNSVPASVYPVMPSPVFASEIPSTYPMMTSLIPSSASPTPAYPVPSPEGSALCPLPSSPPPTTTTLSPMYSLMPVARP